MQCLRCCMNSFGDIGVKFVRFIFAAFNMYMTEIQLLLPLFHLCGCNEGISNQSVK